MSEQNLLKSTKLEFTLLIETIATKGELDEVGSRTLLAKAENVEAALKVEKELERLNGVRIKCLK